MKKIIVPAAILAALTAVYVAGQSHAQVQLGAPTTGKRPTRIAFINIEVVLQNYKKAQRYKQDMDALIGPKRIQAEKLKEESKRLDTLLADSKLDAEKRQLLEEAKRGVKAKLDELQREVGAMYAKRSEREIVTIYKEIDEAVKSHAKRHDFQAVLCYGESPQSDPNSVENIVRKIRGIESSGCVMPLYFEPSLDISTAVSEALNQAYEAQSDAGRKARGCRHTVLT